MITVKLMGGLGNQLFQYAFGKRLAQETGLDVSFETSFFRKNPHRPLDLRVLDPHLPIAAPHRVPRKARHYSYQTRILDYLFPRMIEHYEQGRGFDETLLRAARPHSYFEGFWQSTHYVRPVEAALRTDLRPDAVVLSERAQSMLAQIQQTNSVGVHVRRGDYVDNPVHQATYVTCSPAYFGQGMAHVAGQVAEPHFFIFSDDAPWARAHLRFPAHRVTYVQGQTSLEDFVLLRACHHQVIPNSTFGWWAAWLNEHPEKIVVMPRHWFRHPRQQATVPELWFNGVVTY